jgi:hypothetical protein
MDGFHLPLRQQHQWLPSSLSLNLKLLLPRPLAMLSQVLDNLVFQILLALIPFQMFLELVNQGFHHRASLSLPSKYFLEMNRTLSLM